VLLRDAAGHEVPGHLLGAAQGAEDGRVCVVLDDPSAIVLALGGEAELELAPLDEARSVRLRGRVLQHRVGRDAGWYVLEIDEVDRPLLGAGSNRRAHLRARPTVSAPIAARLAAPDGAGARDVTVKDLSEGGAGLIVRPPEDLELLAQPRLRLDLRLTADEPPLELMTRLVFRRQSGLLLHYGVAFDALASIGFEQARLRLAAWVVARQTAQQAAARPTRRAG
jgi:hypothetical protein